MSKRTCEVETCPEPLGSSRWCRAHWGRWKATGDVQADRPIKRRVRRGHPKPKCKVDTCVNSAPLESGLCPGHVTRLRKRGDVQADVPLMRAKAAERCSRPDCDSSDHMRGDVCSKHYQRFRKYGSYDLPARVKLHCTVKDCDAKHVAQGYCASHYEQWSNHGDPLKRKFYRSTNNPVECTVEGCHLPYHAKGNCKTHDLQARHEANRDANNARMRKHGKAHREIYRAAKARRRQRESVGNLTAEDRELSVAYRFAIGADPCLYCGLPGAADDHFFPLAKGGTDHWWNLVRACQRCNLSKSAHCGTWFLLRPTRVARAA